MTASLLHIDLCKYNMIINSLHIVISVLEQENAFVAPWEMVEFTKDMNIILPIIAKPP